MILETRKTEWIRIQISVSGSKYIYCTVFGSSTLGYRHKMVCIFLFDIQYEPTVCHPMILQVDIGHLFVFERDVDWTSCLLSPLTYEGLLDEVFGIR